MSALVVQLECLDEQMRGKKKRRKKDVMQEEERRVWYGVRKAKEHLLGC
jgi:hypothetical protein